MSGPRLLLGFVLTCAAVGAQQPPQARRIVEVHVHAYTRDERLGSRLTVPTMGELLVAPEMPATIKWRPSPP